MTKVKICGITNDDDAIKACLRGAWAIGFIFDKKSPRYISASKVRKIVDKLPPFITPVGVFVNQRERAVKDVCRFAGITTIQFHGEETPQYCGRFKDHKIIKAFRVNEKFDGKEVAKYDVDAYLFDSYQEDAHGGTGKTFNWDIITAYTFKRPIILSGGLDAQNIKEAVEKVEPYAVDVSSGVEKSPGQKDPRKLSLFFDTLNFRA